MRTFRDPTPDLFSLQKYDGTPLPESDEVAIDTYLASIGLEVAHIRGQAMVDLSSQPHEVLSEIVEGIKQASPNVFVLHQKHVASRSVSAGG